MERNSVYALDVDDETSLLMFVFVTTEVNVHSFSKPLKVTCDVIVLTGYEDRRVRVPQNGLIREEIYYKSLFRSKCRNRYLSHSFICLHIN